MNEERRFAPENLVRVNVEVDTRDIHARWTETSEIVVRGEEVDAEVQVDELFIGSDAGRRHNPGPLDIELPSRSMRYEFKVLRGDVRLLNAQGRIDLNVESGDVAISGGVGTLAIASGKGDVKVDRYAGELIINSGSGDKHVQAVEGDITIRSGKGDVHLSDGSGRTTIASASGDVHIQNRDCGELTLAGARGDVMISGGFIAGNGTISTASGDIHCQAGLGLANYEISASSGDISFSVPREIAARVDAATTRGSVTTELPLVAIAQRGPRNPHGKRLVGSTGDTTERASITLRTSSGDISVRWGPSADSLPARPIQGQPGTGVAVTPPAEPLSAPPAPASSAPDDAEPSTEDPDPFDLVEDRKRAILSALADGAISTEEAGMLLDALEATTTAPNGA